MYETNPSMNRTSIKHPRGFINWHSREYPVNAVPGVDFWNNTPIPADLSPEFKSAPPPFSGIFGGEDEEI